MKKFLRQRTPPVITSVQEALKFTSGASPAEKVTLSEPEIREKRERQAIEHLSARARQDSSVAELMTEFEREKLDFRSKGGWR